MKNVAVFRYDLLPVLEALVLMNTPHGIAQAVPMLFIQHAGQMLNRILAAGREATARFATVRES